jgi:benzoate/toluate 1,2-dioxygenase beta subunit
MTDGAAGAERTPADLVAEAAAFLAHEAWLLDERRWEDWRDLFAPNGLYWVPARPGQTDWKHEVSLYLDDVKGIQARIDRLRHPRAHAQVPPSQTVHAVSNVHLDPDALDLPGAIGVRSVVTMTEWRKGVQRIHVGRVRHVLVRTEAGLRIRLKRIDLVDAEDVHGPMSVPF